MSAGSSSCGRRRSNVLAVLIEFRRAWGGRCFSPHSRDQQIHPESTRKLFEETYSYVAVLGRPLFVLWFGARL